MNCPYCHALNRRERRATQQLTFEIVRFGRIYTQTSGLCDEHASMVRLTHKINGTALLTIDTRKE